jgi:hypothetical protein
MDPLFIKCNKRKPRTRLPNEEGVQVVALVVEQEKAPQVVEENALVIVGEEVLVVAEQLPPVVVQEEHMTPIKYVKRVVLKKLTPKKNMV